MRNQILKHEEDKDLSFSLVLIEEYFYANLILAGLDFAMQLFAASSQPLKSRSPYSYISHPPILYPLVTNF